MMTSVDCTSEKEPTTQVIAHRGASAYAPENTLAAFRLAAEMKAPWFELDCTLSLDGDVVVIHDDTLDRTTALEGRVMDTATKLMTEADAGTWKDAKFSEERVPLLSETLDFAKNTIGVYIEIKNSDNDRELEAEILALRDDDAPFTSEQLKTVLTLIEKSESKNLELTRKVIQLVRDRKMGKEVVIQSFSPIVCAAALIEASELRTELLASASDDKPEVWINFQRWVQLLDVPGFNINKRLATQELVDAMHEQGRTVAVWTVNKKYDMQKFNEMGVDFIITDAPDVALEILH
jgi:glycerophosphoryl diester phosphodiesterase